MPCNTKEQGKKVAFSVNKNKKSTRKQADRPLVADKGDNHYRIRLMRVFRLAPVAC
jgi:hypothetical protein